MATFFTVITKTDNQIILVLVAVVVMLWLLLREERTTNQKLAENLGKSNLTGQRILDLIQVVCDVITRGPR